MASNSQDWEIPTFQEYIFSEKSTQYCLVIPVINEGTRIHDELHRIHELGVSNKLDIILADGGSSDGSLNSTLLKSTNISALLIKTGPGRLSAQLRMGYSWALQRGYEGIITIDGNGKDSEESIPLFIQALDDGIDYAQASRFIQGGKSINAPKLRLLAIRLLHAPLISLTARFWFTDTTQGFRSYSRRYLLDDRVKPFRNCFMDYELLAYLSVRATQLGYKAKEIPTTRAYPQGEIPTKIPPIQGSLDLLKTLLATCCNRFVP